MLKRLTAILGRRWVLGLLGVVLLSVLVWFVGPLIAVAGAVPLESLLVRVIVIAALFLLWVLAVLLAALRAARSEKRIAEAIAEPTEADPSAAMADEEELLLRERLQGALAQLKRSAGGRRGRTYLYELPWYVLVGAPGTGKTTALLNSGLSFPLAERFGKGGLRGVGGTRNCDWYFSDRAVLLDTAGRYTTQDSHRAVDKAAWEAFLKMLAEARPHQPINGLLVAVSLADIITGSASERLAQAQALRERVREVHDALGLRPPIYVLLTKCDLLAGFTEHFDDLGKAERDQVWGMTFPLEAADTEGGAVARFAVEFDALCARLDGRLLDRLQQELDTRRRAQVFAFPQQFAAIREPLEEFLNEAFRPSRYDRPPLLRGVYFTSATQEGTPIDRLMGRIAASFGLDRLRVPAFSGVERSFFLTRLLNEVVFEEAGLVGGNVRLERRWRWLRRGAFAGLAVATLALLGGWAYSYHQNRATIDHYETATTGLDEAMTALLEAPFDDPRLEPVLEPLASLRTLSRYNLAGDDGTTWDTAPQSARLGLYQGEKLRAQASAAYRRAITGALLPRLLVRIEDQLRLNIRRADFVYEALKTYLMMGGQGPLDAELVRQWHLLDWELSGFDTAQRQALTNHLDELLRARLTNAPLDGDLVAEARLVVGQIPLAERAYRAIQQSETAQGLPIWRIIDAAGPAAPRVFTRASGRPLTEGVPGLYTRDGFHYVLLPALDDAARAMAHESWVMGNAGESERYDEERLRLEVLDLYLDDYIARWSGILADVAIPQFPGLQQATDAMNVLSGRNSPLRNLLAAVARETQLSEPPTEDALVPEGLRDALSTAALRRAQSRAPAAARLAQIMASARGGTAAADDARNLPGSRVDDRFRDLHRYVLGNGAAPEIDDLLVDLEALHLQLSRMSRGADPLLVDEGAAQRLSLAATRMPSPASDWVEQIAQGSASLAAGGARSRLDAEWTSNVVPLCQQALRGRYPFDRGSPTDVTLGDFSRLFAPGGLIDGFFNTHLRSFVDTASLPWRWRDTDADLGIPDSTLRQFQRAATIRDSFFRADPAQPRVEFQLTPLQLAAQYTQVLIEIDGQALSYAHGPVRPAAFVWPGSDGVGAARLSFTRTFGTPPPSYGFSGPWALFRLLDAGTRRQGSLSDRVQIAFGAPGDGAVFELQAGSVINPFNLRELGEFQCPPSL